MSIGTFAIVKNEAQWIAAHVLRIIRYVDEMVLFDGNSKDGTVEILREIAKTHPDGHKLKVHLHMDPVDLKDDYVRVSNKCMRALSTDLAYFIHPDMFLVNPEILLKVRDSNAIALTTKMRSFAGEPGGRLYEIKGRGEVWKNIYRLKNPDLGAHYFGHYGAQNEDVYFSSITGDAHEHYGQNVHWYPYAVEPSGIEVLHFSDVRSHLRRYERMVRCLENQGYGPEERKEVALAHPRVTLKDGHGFNFIPSEYPKEFVSDQQKYAHLIKEPVNV